MGRASSAGVVTGVLVPTALLDPAGLAEVRALMGAAFDDFTEEDWDHGLGGLHALVRVDGELVAHGGLVQRRLLVGGRWLRCGYVEAVAVHPDHRRRGHGARVMADLEALAPGHDLLALGASDAGVALYEARGWQRWRGPSSVLSPAGIVATPDDDGGLFVLGGPARLDLDGPITCDWRPGDVW